MKRTALISMFLILVVFVGTSFAVKVTLFGKNQYSQSGLYSEAFPAEPGYGKIIVRNHGLEDVVIKLNGKKVFNEIDDDVSRLRKRVSLLKSNNLSVDINTNDNEDSGDSDNGDDSDHEGDEDDKDHEDDED